MYNFETVAQDKCDKIAVEFRNSGNIKYQEKHFTLALLDYNKSIAFAKSNEVIALGYANRSAVYFELKRYKDCMKNIEWALENNYPVDKAAKLIDRKEKCEKLMQTSKDVPDIREYFEELFKLSYPQNKNIPWIADCVTVKWTPKYGRGIYATRDLKAGDVICVEESIVPLMEENGFYGRCYNCSKTVFLNLIPCDKTASLMFCSNACKKELYAKAVDIQTIHCPDMRILSEFANLAGGINNLEQIIETTNWQDPKKTVFDYDLSNSNDPNFKRNLLICFLSMWFDEEKDLSLDNKFVFCRLHTSPQTVKRILSLFTNNISNFSYNRGKKVLVPYSCFYLFGSLLNHSCVPNAAFLLMDNKVVTIVFTPINKGEQIFWRYSSNTLVTHGFVCECQFCISGNRCIPNPVINPLPFELIRHKNYVKVKEWIKYALNTINNAPNQQTFWDRIPQTYCFVMATIGGVCSFP